MMKRIIYQLSTRKPKLYVFGGQGTQEKGILKTLISTENDQKFVR